jgi:hypothetical protein
MYVDPSAAFLSKKGPRYCLKKKAWVGPRDGLGAVKKEEILPCVYRITRIKSRRIKEHNRTM